MKKVIQQIELPEAFIIEQKKSEQFDVFLPLISLFDFEEPEKKEPDLIIIEL